MLPTKPTLRWIIFSSLLLWIISLCVPALAFNLNPGQSASIVHHSGFEMMFSSLFGPFELNFAVLANPLLLIGWIFLHQQRFHRCYMTLGFALLFALQTFQLYVFPFMENEAGTKSYLTHPLIGWYLWMAAIILPFAAAIHFNNLAKKIPPPPVPETAAV